MTRFDRVAGAVDRVISRAPFFALCLLLVLGWVVLGFFMGWSNDLYHLLLNSPTTAGTFLLVALQANASHRDAIAFHAKLDAIAQGLADMMDEHPELAGDVAELRQAVGLEERTGTGKAA